MGPREIARQMKLTPGTVIGVLDREGLCASSVAASREWRETVKAMRLMRERGLTLREIAGAFDMPLSTVSDHIRRAA